jgi:hypothetical protein
MSEKFDSSELEGEINDKNLKKAKRSILGFLNKGYEEAKIEEIKSEYRQAELQEATKEAILEYLEKNKFNEAAINQAEKIRNGLSVPADIYEDPEFQKKLFLEFLKNFPLKK